MNERKASELERAMVVVMACIKVQDHPGTVCALCSGFEWRVDDGAPRSNHDDDCPLVVQGFVTKEGVFCI